MYLPFRMLPGLRNSCFLSGKVIFRHAEYTAAFAAVQQVSFLYRYLSGNTCQHLRYRFGIPAQNQILPDRLKQGTGFTQKSCLENHRCLRAGKDMIQAR